MAKLKDAGATNIIVTDQDLIDTAQDYRNNISKMKTILEDATANIDKSNSVWEGIAGEELRSKYDRLKSGFDSFCQSIEEFAKFLDNSAQEYKQKELAIQKAAEETLSTFEQL